MASTRKLSNPCVQVAEEMLRLLITILTARDFTAV
jgi:hypothetical protein